MDVPGTDEDLGDSRRRIPERTPDGLDVLRIETGHAARLQRAMTFQVPGARLDNQGWS
jgi:hypothetical protein